MFDEKIVNKYSQNKKVICRFIVAPSLLLAERSHSSNLMEISLRLSQVFAVAESQLYVIKY